MLDPEAPDDRPMVNADPPGYALHRWTRHGMVTVQEHVLLAKFDESMQPLVRHMFQERAV